MENYVREWSQKGEREREREVVGVVMAPVRVAAADAWLGMAVVVVGVRRDDSGGETKELRIENL